MQRRKRRVSHGPILQSILSSNLGTRESKIESRSLFLRTTCTCTCSKYYNVQHVYSRFLLCSISLNSNFGNEQQIGIPVWGKENKQMHRTRSAAWISSMSQLLCLRDRPLLELAVHTSHLRLTFFLRHFSVSISTFGNLIIITRLGPSYLIQAISIVRILNVYLVG